jgi:hypothetical protein
MERQLKRKRPFRVSLRWRSTALWLARRSARFKRLLCLAVRLPPPLVLAWPLTLGVARGRSERTWAKGGPVQTEFETFEQPSDAAGQSGDMVSIVKVDATPACEEYEPK